MGRWLIGIGLLLGTLAASDTAVAQTLKWPRLLPFRPRSQELPSVISPIYPARSGPGVAPSSTGVAGQIGDSRPGASELERTTFLAPVNEPLAGSSASGGAMTPSGESATGGAVDYRVPAWQWWRVPISDWFRPRQRALGRAAGAHDFSESRLVPGRDGANATPHGLDWPAWSAPKPRWLGGPAAPVPPAPAPLRSSAGRQPPVRY
jgi:hypothetical protein